MALHISLTALLVILTVILIWKAGMKWWHALIVLLAGFYLASTGVAPAINNASTSVANLFSGLHL